MELKGFLRVFPVDFPSYRYVFISYETLITLSYSYLTIPTIPCSLISAARPSSVHGRLLADGYRPVSGHPIQEEEDARERTDPSYGKIELLIIHIPRSGPATIHHDRRRVLYYN